MKRMCKLTVALIFSVLALGCGGNGASNNDQGVSVSFLGLFSSLPTQNSSSATTSGTGGCASLPGSINGGYISLGLTAIDPAATPLPGFTGLAVDPAGAVHAIVGIQNNMSGQFFRADRVLLEYYVPGASVQPPSTNVAVNFLAGPAESGSSTTTGGANSGLRKPAVTSLPPSLSQVCNRAFASVPILPSPIREWLNFNRAQLPEAPFDLEIIVKLSGLSSSGNRYETNAGVFSFNVVADVAVDPADVTATSVINGDSGEADNAATFSVGEGDDEGETLGLDELESAFETQSVVPGE